MGQILRTFQLKVFTLFFLFEIKHNQLKHALALSPLALSPLTLTSRNSAAYSTFLSSSHSITNFPCS